VDSAAVTGHGLARVPSDARTAVSRNDLPKALALYRVMLASRLVDKVEMELVNRGEAFFHVGGAGHEACAALNAHLTPDDWLHLHYRDKALMLARGISAEQFFHSSLCTTGSHSAGRQMSAHLSAPELKILSLVGPVGNNALQAVGVAHEVVAERQRTARNGVAPLVVCAVGDSTSQQGEFLEAVAEAVRAQLPVLFWIEDNGYGISTKTGGNTFYDRPDGEASEFYGMTVHRLDGRDALACDAALGPIAASVRAGRPTVIVFQVERLTHHTNADDEKIYREEGELKQVRAEADPITRLREQLLVSGVTEAQLDQTATELEAEIRAAAERALATPNPVANLDARVPLGGQASRLPGPPVVPTGEDLAPVETTGSQAGRRPALLSMMDAMREVLRHHLGSDSRVTLFGQDIEDPKGDVFGLTRGLTRAFPAQIKNSALTESTIVGVSVGRALAGGRPVAFIQFADFVPLAFNQIAAELGSMFWRTDGGWRCPVIVLAPCGGYRPGLGPFHAQTFESVLTHVPGIDVVMPSTAADAAGLLNAAFANQSSGRPTVFLYPKVCLNDPSLAAPAAALNKVLQPGEARFVTRGNDLTVVTWGGTTPLCLKAVRALEAAGVGVDLIDLRSLSPWDEDAVCASAGRTGRLIVVHEDNHTCGFGAEVLATVSERVESPIKARRVTRPDTYVPCNYVNQLEVLPSLKRILEACADLCQLDLKWEGDAPAADGLTVLEAVGSSPADQSVAVVEWKVRDGDTIKAGDLIADCEADKATFELRAPVGGVIHELLPVDEKVSVGSALAKIATAKSGPVLPKRVPVELKPVLQRRAGVSPARPVAAATALPIQRAGETPAPRRQVIGISSIIATPAGRIVTNEELVRRFPGRSAADIVQRTGIESRPLLAEGETVLTLATKAARSALRETGLTLADLDAIFVSTSSPLSLSPSMACLLHHQLSLDGVTKDVPASDILAACSGYLYALQAAFDFCQSQPGANILVVTAEAMSTFTDPDDFDTAIVFADAATATLVHGPESTKFAAARALLHRPVLSARGEDGTVLHHGRRGNPNVNMDGLKVFPMAVRQMITLLDRACVETDLKVGDLDHIIPHQANGRILEAVATRLKQPPGRLVNRVKHAGNSSSSTIPLVLAELLNEQPTGKAGLCAFGGGFTFGAAVLEFV
jgi:2-oxoisovalerate dehydrogenase E1 component